MKILFFVCTLFFHTTIIFLSYLIVFFGYCVWFHNLGFILVRTSSTGSETHCDEQRCPCRFIRTSPHTVKVMNLVYTRFHGCPCRDSNPGFRRERATSLATRLQRHEGKSKRCVLNVTISLEQKQNGSLKKGLALQDYALDFALFWSFELYGDTMKINSLILRELLRRGYSLEGKTRIWNIADSKLWYLTPEQARAYLDIVSSPNYQKDIRPKESQLTELRYKDILGFVHSDSLNVIDLGCGDGKKAAFLIDKMRDRKKVRYYPIDISSYMVKTAINNVRHLENAEIVDVGWNISDFENLQNISRLFDKKNFKNNLFLLLGNTLGNFEIHELLYELSSSMQEGDFLLIGNGLNNENVEEDIVRACKENPGFERFFRYIPLQLGLSREDVSFDIRFRNSRIEFYFVLKDDTTVTFQEKQVQFYKGDQIVVGVSYHYKKEEFISYLKMYFGNVRTFVSSDGSYALALCQK